MTKYETHPLQNPRNLLAVTDRGCRIVLIVFLLTLAGWVPGVIAALVILNKN